MKPRAIDGPALGRFDSYGGRFVSELLMPALSELETAYRQWFGDKEFRGNLHAELRSWAGRPTPLTHVPRFSATCRLEVILKREDLLHGGAHKINNVVGQALLARKMGKRRLIAETGAGQHGVATAMAGARFGLETVIYMGARDMERQRPNVLRMELCGARVVAVHGGSATLKDAINEALRDWAENLEDTHYLLGTVCGPDPFPSLVRDLQAIIGREARAGFLRNTGRLPDAVAACVGGGSNAIGIFHSFLDDPVGLFGVEASGRGQKAGDHARTLGRGSPGLLHGARTYLLQDREGQVQESYSIAAGLDYPGVGPEHAALKDRGRARYVGIDDEEALNAFRDLSSLEGIIPALESAHALAFAQTAVSRGWLEERSMLLVNLSGRGDKDLGRS